MINFPKPKKITLKWVLLDIEHTDYTGRVRSRTTKIQTSKSRRWTIRVWLIGDLVVWRTKEGGNTSLKAAPISKIIMMEFEKPDAL